METEITRLIASAIAALVLGYVLYVAAYVKHKTEKQEDYYDFALREKDFCSKSGEEIRDPPADVILKKEKSESWYMGYRLAAVVAVLAAAAVGWAAAWIASQEYGELTQVEDCIVAAAGALLGGLVVDRYVIHPIADGKFWEKVEVPIIERFLHPDQGDVEAPAKVSKLAAKRAAKKVAKEEEIAPAPVPLPPEEEAALTPAVEEDPLLKLSFDDRVKLIEKLKKSL